MHAHHLQHIALFDSPLPSRSVREEVKGVLNVALKPPLVLRLANILKTNTWMMLSAQNFNSQALLITYYRALSVESPVVESVNQQQLH
jgi:hypothetical protein